MCATTVGKQRNNFGCDAGSGDEASILQAHKWGRREGFQTCILVSKLKFVLL